MQTYKHTYIHKCLLLLISMLWHRQTIFESKGDKLSSSAECMNQGLWNRISSRLNARWQTDWAIEDQAKKNMKSTARPFDQRACSPLDPTAIWLSHLALAIYMFVVVNFDALAQASYFQIERRQVVSLFWMQDLNQGLWNQISSRLNARWQTDWAIEDQAKKTWSTNVDLSSISSRGIHLRTVLRDTSAVNLNNFENYFFSKISLRYPDGHWVKDNSVGGIHTTFSWFIVTLQWRHNEHDGVSNHLSLDGLLNRLFRRRSKKTSKLRVTGLCSSPHKGLLTRKKVPFGDVIMR